MQQLDSICAYVAQTIGADPLVVRESVTSWLARAAEVLEEQHVVDLGEVGRLFRVRVPSPEDEIEVHVTVHRPYVAPIAGRYVGIRFDENVKLGPVRKLE